MGEDGKKIDLNKIKKIPKEEFKKQMLNWIEDRDLSKVLQSKLRKDLFDNFNKTAIGRKITSEFHSNYRLFLSPIFLALHALIAEFLYSQNCHFSLSVFSSEVPYKHILPNFEKTEHFRFSNTEINELLEALGIKVANNDQIHLIQSSYHSGTNEGNPLLLCLIKFWLNLMTVKQTTGIIQVNRTTSMDRNVFREKPINPFDNKNNENGVNTASEQIKYMNKYMKGLGKQIKHLSSDLQILQRRTTKQHQQRNKKKIIKNHNKSILCENLKVKTQHKYKQNISFIVRNIDKLTTRMDWCVNHFENILKLIKDDDEKYDKNADKQQQNDKLFKKFINLDSATTCSNKIIYEKNLPSYGDWVKELKISNHGKKFMQRLENSLYKTIEKEKEKLEKVYQEKLEDQKAILRLHYKQKYKEQKCDAAQVATAVANETSASIQHKEVLDDLIDRKLKLLDDREQDINEKVNKLREEIKLYENEKLKFIENNQKLEKIKAQNTGDARRRRRNSLSYHTACRIDIMPTNVPVSMDGDTAHVVPLTELNVKNHENIENIVYEAQKRIHDLEMESELLENSFQNYLKKYYIDNNKNNYYYKNIIDNYNYNKNLLTIKKLTATTGTITGGEQSANIAAVSAAAASCVSNYIGDKNNTLSAELLKLNNNNNNTEYNYENPFKNFTKTLMNVNNESLKHCYPSNKEINSKLQTIQQQLIQQTNENVNKIIKNDDNKKLLLSPYGNVTIATASTPHSIGDGISSDLNLKNITLDDDFIVGSDDAKISSVNTSKNEGMMSSKKNVQFDQIKSVENSLASDEQIIISTGDDKLIDNQQNDDEFWK